MKPKFAEVTLNSFIFVLNIFCTNLARKFGMINITHEVNFFIGVMGKQYPYLRKLMNMPK